MQRAIKIRSVHGSRDSASALVCSDLRRGIRSAYQTRTMNQWVSQTQDVLTEAASVRLTRLRMRNDMWFYRATGSGEFRSKYEMKAS